MRLGDVAEQCLGKMLDAQKNKGRPFPYLRNPNVRWFDVDTSDLREMPVIGRSHRHRLVAKEAVVRVARLHDVLLDRDGIVRVYHPGRMTEVELDTAIRALLDPVRGAHP